uniref:Uncharacterized protein n=1 Tax=Ananas comosus var. bracteatus TaxID=296719 RepID=A0A6V7P559_ANACO|nr:unnamed protein product [Ananas comosus var. bracteatus]
MAGLDTRRAGFRWVPGRDRRPLILASTRAILDSVVNSAKSIGAAEDDGVLRPPGILRVVHEGGGANEEFNELSSFVGVSADVLRRLAITSGSALFSAVEVESFEFCTSGFVAQKITPVPYNSKSFKFFVCETPGSAYRKIIAFINALLSDIDSDIPQFASFLVTAIEPANEPILQVNRNQTALVLGRGAASAIPSYNFVSNSNVPMPLQGAQYSPCILLLRHFDVFANLSSNEGSPSDQAGITSEVASVIREFSNPLPEDDESYPAKDANGGLVPNVKWEDVGRLEEVKKSILDTVQSLPLWVRLGTAAKASPLAR